MPLVKDVKYIKEPTPLQCGQAVLAMLSGKSVDEVIKFTATDRETNLKQMFLFLENVNIKYSAERVAVNTKDEWMIFQKVIANIILKLKSKRPILVYAKIGLF